VTDDGHEPVRVIIADDEPLVRADIRAILDSDAGIEIVGEASDGHEAVELVRATHPDVAVLDIRMPRMSGIEATSELRELGAHTAVVILTTFGNDDNIAQAIGAGADGFLIKASAPRDLIAGVITVAGGGSALSPHVAKLLVSKLRESNSVGDADALGRVDALTERERSVLALLGRGLSNAEIAADLWISEATVKGHVSSILQRLGANNRVQAAIIAYEAGMVPARD
jgi:DNA-binding NarL/FixJ family response regulator